MVPGAIGLAAVSAIFTTRSAGNLSDVITVITTVLAVTLGIVTSSRALTPSQIEVRPGTSD